MGSKQIINLEEILAHAYPRVYRVAMALCGDRKAAKSVVTNVLRHSGVMLDRVEDAAAADRWFLRYTVQCSRETVSRGSKDDPLFAAAGSPAMQAIVVSIRHLPPQQREAFLLEYGEHLDLRPLATAMDCSTAAATNHLRAATESLHAISGETLNEFIDQLPAMMRQLSPEPGTVTVEINRVIRRHRRKIWLRRWILLPVKAALLAAAVWLAWILWHRWR